MQERDGRHGDATIQSGIQADGDGLPTALVEEVALIGPLKKVRADPDAWKASLVTMLLVSGPVPLLQTMAKLVL